MSNPITHFAHTSSRGKRLRFGIKRNDRRYHMHLLGKTGVGKSTLMQTMMASDIAHGEGFALFDPHGDLAEKVRSLVPPDRQADLIYLAPEGGWHFNPLSDIPAQERPRAATGMVDVMHKLWPDDWGPRLEHVLRHSLYTLLSYPGTSLADLKRLFFDEEFRSEAVRYVRNAEVLSFWHEEFQAFSPRMQAVVVAPILNKISAFLTDPTLRRILTGESTFNLRHVIDDGQILIINLSKGILGEGPAQLLGSLLLSHLSLAAFARAEVPEESRRDFFVYVDEFQNFGTRAFSGMLAELRKYRLSFVLANQYLSQLDSHVRDSVLGNVGTLVAFRLGASDASLIAREMMPKITAEDLVNLPNFHIYLRLMIDSQVSRAFSAEALAFAPHRTAQHA